MNRRLTFALCLLVLCTAASAETYTESHQLYDFKIDYRFEEDRLIYEMEIQNNLDIALKFYSVDVAVECASGKKPTVSLWASGTTLMPWESKRFDEATAVECSPTKRYNRQTKQHEVTPDSIVSAAPLRVGVFQNDTSSDASHWDCGDETITVVAVKMKHGPSFRLKASNNRSMTTKPGSFKLQEAIEHLCGRTPSEPDRIQQAAGMVNDLISKWEAFCKRAPDFCDSAYDGHNKRGEEDKRPTNTRASGVRS